MLSNNDIVAFGEVGINMLYRFLNPVTEQALGSIRSIPEAENDDGHPGIMGGVITPLERRVGIADFDAAGKNKGEEETDVIALGNGVGTHESQLSGSASNVISTLKEPKGAADCLLDIIA